MRWNTRKIGYVLLVVIFTALAARVLWHASTTETGWATLTRQVRGSVLVWFQYPPVNVAYRSWGDQADFWMDVSDRVQARYPEDPTMAMMSAQTMREHSIFANMIELRLGYGVPGPPVTIGFSHYDQSDVPPGYEFHQRCSQRRLELALHAAELDPENVVWWRMASWLVGPDTPEWESILQKCAAHDPENACYDYIAAIFHWHSSGSYSSRGQAGPKFEYATSMSITDPETFQKGIAAFERGLAKPLLNLGERDQFQVFNRGEIDRFVEAAGLGIDEQPLDFETSLMQGIFQNPWRRLMVSSLLCWQSARAAELAQQGQGEAAFAQLRQAERLLEQLEHEGSSAQSSEDWGPARQFVPFVRDQVARHPEMKLQEDRLREIEHELQRAEREYQVWRATMQKHQQHRYDTISPMLEPLHERQPWINMLVGMLPSLIPPLLVLAVVAAAVTRGVGGQVAPGPPWWLGAGAFLLCSVLSVTLFGLAPAAILPPIATHWILTGVVILVPLGTLAVLVIRGFRGGLRLRHFFVAIGVFAATFWLVRFSHMSVHNPDRWFPFYLEVPPNVFWLRSSEVPYGQLWRVALEWTVYQGPWVAILGTLAIIAAWQLRPSSWRSASQPFPESWRDRISSVAWPFATSSLAIAAANFSVCLVLAPAIIQDIDRPHQVFAEVLDAQAEYMEKREAEFQAIKRENGGDLP